MKIITEFQKSIAARLEEARLQAFREVLLANAGMTFEELRALLNADVSEVLRSAPVLSIFQVASQSPAVMSQAPSKVRTESPERPPSTGKHNATRTKPTGTKPSRTSAANATRAKDAQRSALALKQYGESILAAMQAAQKRLEPGTELEVNDFRAKVGGTKSQFRRALGKLLSEGKVAKTGDRRFTRYTLP